MITRRTLSKLALCSTLAVPSGVASAVLHRDAPQDWADRLTKDMNAALAPGCEGRFEVVWLDHREASVAVMEANIRLHWPPGLRNRPFLGTGDDGEAAFEALKAEALAHYRKVWTNADGSSCVGKP